MTQLLITLDIDTDRPKARAVMISAARPDEMPVIVFCAFAERHAVLDAVYVAALQRKESKVKKPAEKKATTPAQFDAAARAKAEAEAAAKTQATDTPAAAVEPEAAEPQPAGQLARPEAEAAPAELPVIDGDDAPADTPGHQPELTLNLEN